MEGGFHVPRLSTRSPSGATSPNSGANPGRSGTANSSSALRAKSGPRDVNGADFDLTDAHLLGGTGTPQRRSGTPPPDLSQAIQALSVVARLRLPYRPSINRCHSRTPFIGGHYGAATAEKVSRHGNRICHTRPCRSRRTLQS